MDFIKSKWGFLILGIILGGTLLAVPVAMLVSFIQSKTGLSLTPSAAAVTATTTGSA